MRSGLASGQARAHPLDHATMTRFRVAGLGTALPQKVVTNADMARYLDTSDEWVMSRTGIRERRIAGPGESTGKLALAAAHDALANADIAPADIDLVLVTTSTPEHPMPSTASEVAAALGIPAGAFDLNAACAGFVYGLTTAGAYLEAGLAHNVLLIGAETMSRIVDQTDRATAVLFGDGAGALVLVGPRGAATTPTAGAAGGPLRQTAPTGGILACDMVDDPDGVELLVVPAGGSAEPASHESVEQGRHHIQMDGREVFRRAVRGVTDSIERTLAQAGAEPDDVDLFILHQANSRIIEAVLNRVGIPTERAVQTVDRHGNTSAASIPLAFADATGKGQLGDGRLVLTSGFGAGFTIGTVLLLWQTS